MPAAFWPAPRCRRLYITASAGGGDAANPITVVDGPAAAGQVFAEDLIPVDAFQNMTARAALDIAGHSALDLDGVFRTSGAPHLAGLPFPQVTDGVTTWTSTLTNNAALPKSYIYSFLLHPIRLSNFDNFIPNTDPLATESSFAVEVRANGNLVFEATALLRGASNGNELIKTRNFDGSGGGVSMGDPLGLKGDPGVSSVVFGEDEQVGAAPVSWTAAKRLYR